MLDRFVFGDARRISPEASVPVFRQRTVTEILGGGGNVARNIASLGGIAHLVGVVGKDEAGACVMRASAQQGGLRPKLHPVEGRPTTVKTRIVANDHHVMRFDVEDETALGAGLHRLLLQSVEGQLRGALVLSDYAKGVITPDLSRDLIALARKAGVPVLVDPKTRALDHFPGATLLSPNIAEAFAATGIDCTQDSDAVAAARMLLQMTQCEAIVLKRGPRGLTLVEKGRNEPIHLAASANVVNDVSGAGNTVVAVLAMSLAVGHSFEIAARLANKAAGIVVGKIATAVVEPHELTAAMGSAAMQCAGKIVSLEAARAITTQWREAGERFAVTNGCFDILHLGHLKLLQCAKAEAERLVVAVNADASVWRLKGKGRPVQDHATRAMVLASLSAVDLVVVFEEDTPLDVIENLSPDVLVKGADYRAQDIIGGAFVQGIGGRLVLVPLQEGVSTTRTIDRIAALPTT